MFNRLWPLSLALTLAILFGIAAQSAALAQSGDDSGYAHPEWLVGARWLYEHGSDSSVKIVALTPKADFVSGHIDGAAQIDWPALGLSDTSPASVARWRKSVEGMLTRLGIERDDTVVVYDGGTLFAARLWWVLNYLGHEDTRILNGGLPAWTATGGRLVQGPSTVRPASKPYIGTPQPAVLATLDEVKSRLGRADVQLVDARTKDEYVKGHIPGAVNVNYPTNAVATAPHFWKSAAALRRLYAQAGVEPGKITIPYCSTGVRSAVTDFTLRLIGYQDVRLYTGSWGEWSQHPELPKTAGDQP